MGKSTAQADLRVANPKISQDFIDALDAAHAPLPWNFDGSTVIDNAGFVVCAIDGDHGEQIAAMIVCAANTCGSFRATRRDDATSGS